MASPPGQGYYLSLGYLGPYPPIQIIGRCNVTVRPAFSRTYRPIPIVQRWTSGNQNLIGRNGIISREWSGIVSFIPFMEDDPLF